MAEDWGRVRLEFPDKPENCAAHAKYWFLRMRTAASTWHHVISYVEFVVNVQLRRKLCNQKCN